MCIPDNLDLWQRHDAEQQKQLERLPICADCMEPIQDERAYYINGEFLCLDCMSAYEVNVEDYIE